MQNPVKTTKQFDKWFKNSKIEMEDASLFRIYLQFIDGEYEDMAEVSFDGDNYDIVYSDFKVNVAQKVQIESAIREWNESEVEPSEKEVMEYRKELGHFEYSHGYLMA